MGSCATKERHLAPTLDEEIDRVKRLLRSYGKPAAPMTEVCIGYYRATRLLTALEQTPAEVFLNNEQLKGQYESCFGINLIKQLTQLHEFGMIQTLFNKQHLDAVLLIMNCIAVQLCAAYAYYRITATDYRVTGLTDTQVDQLCTELLNERLTSFVHEIRTFSIQSIANIVLCIWSFRYRAVSTSEYVDGMSYTTRTDRLKAARDMLLLWLPIYARHEPSTAIKVVGERAPLSFDQYVAGRIVY